MLEQASLQVAPRYRRAIHIQRDFHDLRHRLDQYQLTPLVLQSAARVCDALAPDALDRAFSVVGPYGTGKSAFGLFLAHFLQRSAASRRQLLASLGAAHAPLPTDAPTLLALLVPGNNAPLRGAVLDSLLRSLAELRPRSPALDGLLQAVAAAGADPDVSPQAVAALLERAAQLLAAEQRFDGVLLLVDELGQFLDHAARQDDERDLFVLQSLAEMAARSGDTPCLVVTILHQAFERYTLNAGAARRVEWAKVQGRFVDLPFQEPASQMLRMLAHAMRPAGRDPYRAARAAWAGRVAPIAEQLGLRPAEIGAPEWARLLSDCYPLHPTVLLALPALFRQLAQNERSLFAFLYTDEPWGLRDVLAAAAPGEQLPIYRLTELHSYVEAAFGPALFGRARGQRWAELAEARATLAAEPELQRLLTAVGTIGALERSSGLRASRAQVAFALADDPDDPAITDGLLALKQRNQLSYRRHRDSYVVWEGSDLDLDSLALAARRELAERAQLPALLERHADSTPRIARRHSYRTGATRTFAIRYVDLGQLQASRGQAAGFDGELLHLVPADEADLAAAAAWATEPARRDERARIAVLPRRARELRDTLLDLAALHTLFDERPELDSDRAARREVAGRLVEAQQALAQLLADTYGQQSRWFYRSRQAEVADARGVDELLSAACDATYPDAPMVWNELIVRRQLSSAAAKARRSLVEALLSRADEPDLGLSGYPPERAIYESLFKRGRLHRQDDDGQWRIGPPRPDDPLRLRPAWEAMELALAASEGAPLPLAALYALLEGPPYGVKAGLTPLLFVALYAARAGEVALYERDSYLPLPDLAAFERLLARPEQFALRLSRADGARRLVYERLAQALAPRALNLPAQPALLAVALPLLRVMRDLPEWSRQTGRVSPQAQALRRALLDARAPDELLFEALPRACGLAPFGADEPPSAERVEALASALRAGIQELQGAYPALLAWAGEQIALAFGLAGRGALARAELQRRYAGIAGATNDVGLRALGVRLETADDGDEPWVESVAALLAKRPPAQWSDAELPGFELALADLARRFRAVEELALAAGAAPADSGLLRIGIAGGGGELSRLVRSSPDDPAVQGLRAELERALGRHAGLSTEQRAAAIAALLQSLLAASDSTP